MADHPDTAKVQAFLDAADPDGGRKACPRCGCCETFWERCDACDGDGTVLEDDPDTGEEVVDCDTCDGKGGWWHCDCDTNGQHKEEARHG